MSKFSDLQLTVLMVIFPLVALGWAWIFAQALKVGSILFILMAPLFSVVMALGAIRFYLVKRDRYGLLRGSSYNIKAKRWNPSHDQSYYIMPPMP